LSIWEELGFYLGRDEDGLMPTIRDVAERAGVATMTVSRVINDSGYVSDETRAKVEAAIAELGYVPNMLGPSLRFNQTFTLALVLADITNPFWTTIARGVEDAAQANGFSVILCNTDESAEKQEQYLTMLLKRRIDGILLSPVCSAPEPVELIQKHGTEVVVLDRTVPGVEVDVVRGDSIGGAYQLTHHLLELRHRHVVILTGPRDVSTSSERVQGYQRAMAEAGLEGSAESILWGNYTGSSGYEMANLALAAKPRPTALIAANNVIAIGALRAIRDAKLRVPKDISIVAFDDIPEAINADPFLTVAVQPAYQIGYQATRLLLNRLDRDEPEEPVHILLPTELVVRRSSGPPPAPPRGDAGGVPVMVTRDGFIG
jgi:LacI family transcriptional regulator